MFPAEPDMALASRRFGHSDGKLGDGAFRQSRLLRRMITASVEVNVRGRADRHLVVSGSHGRKTEFAAWPSQCLVAAHSDFHSLQPGFARIMSAVIIQIVKNLAGNLTTARQPGHRNLEVVAKSQKDCAFVPLVAAPTTAAATRVGGFDSRPPSLGNLSRDARPDPIRKAFVHIAVERRSASGRPGFR